MIKTSYLVRSFLFPSFSVHHLLSNLSAKKKVHSCIMLPPIVSNLVFPLIGTIICTILWLTPLPVVLEARYTRYMGPTNPYPFVVTVFNCIGWVIYGCLTKDIFLLLSNISGLCLGFYYSIVSLTVIAKKTADSDFSDLYIGVESLLIFAVFFWAIMGYVAATGFSDPAEGTHMVGMLGCAFSVAYYGSPLSSLLQVLQKGDSSSILLPLVCINIINAVLWFGYGLFAKGDPNIWIPNGCGVVLGLIQGFIRLTIPAREVSQGQGIQHYLLLLQGKVPPSFVTSEKIRKQREEHATILDHPDNDAQL